MELTDLQRKAFVSLTEAYIEDLLRIERESGVSMPVIMEIESYIWKALKI